MYCILTRFLRGVTCDLWTCMYCIFDNFFFRRTQASSPIPSAAERTRTLNVTRDDQGFGLTLSGDRPVSVQTVRPGGAAHRAGIREKDVIVKVNGAHVTQSTHTEVVDLIAGKRVVILFFPFSCSRYSCNNITTTLIQISRLFYFGFFSKSNHLMI